MTTKLALILFCIIIGFFVLDHYVLHMDAGIFLARKGVDLLNTIAFWR